MLVDKGGTLNLLIESYIQRFPQDTQARLMRIREIFLSEVPDATEDIKYQMPTIMWHGNLIHYAAFKNHIGIYPLPDVLVTLNEEIKGYKTGKGSIQLQNDEPLPEDLIRLIVKTRLEERLDELANIVIKPMPKNMNSNEHISKIINRISELGVFIEITFKNGKKETYRCIGSSFKNDPDSSTMKAILRLLDKENRGYDIDVMDIESVAKGSVF